MMTMKRAASNASSSRVAAASASTAVTATLLLLLATHHTATEAAGITYQYTGFGSCRDINGNTYSNIQLTDVSATANDLSCGDSCDIFLSSGSSSSGTLRGFEWQLVDGFDRRCYCLFDAGSNVEAMALEFIATTGGGGGATWKGDNVGIGEIDTAVNVGIDSYCYKLDPRVTPSTPLSDSPPTPLPTGWWTLPPLPVEPQTPPPVVVRPTPPPTTDWWTETSVPLPTQPPVVRPTQPPVVGPPPTLQPQTIEEIFQGIFNSSEEVFTTSQVNDDPYEYDYDDADALNNNNKPSTSQNNGWSSSTSHSSTGHVVMGKSSKSSTSSKSSKSGQGLIEGKSDKDDSSLMRLEQMRYKVNGGRRGSGGGGSIEMLLFMATVMTVLSFLVW